MSKTEIIAVVGSRDFSDMKLVEGYIDYLYKETLGIYACRIVSGGARGVDRVAEKKAKQWKLYLKTFNADWEKYGKQAGFIRNKEIVDYADRIIAFWDGESKGTKHTIDLAIKAKKPVNIFVRFKNGR